MSVTREDLVRFKAYCTFCENALSPKGIEYLAEILKVKHMLFGVYTFKTLHSALVEHKRKCKSIEETEIYNEALTTLHDYLFDFWSQPMGKRT